MKIFKLNDCDWFAAETLDQAIAYCKRECGDDGIDDPYELDDAALDRLQFNWTDIEERFVETLSFRAALARCVANGESFPCLFASTEQ